VNEDKMSTLEAVLAVFTLTPIDLYMILICAVLFVGFWKLADKVIFAPFLQLHEAREEATHGASESATTQTAEAEKLTLEYESELTETRVEAMQKKLALLKEARDKAQEIISAAENDARLFLQRERQGLKDQQADLLRQLSGDVDTLAASIVERLLHSEPGEHSQRRH